MLVRRPQLLGAKMCLLGSALSGVPGRSGPAPHKEAQGLPAAPGRHHRMPGSAMPGLHQARAVWQTLGRTQVIFAYLVQDVLLLTFSILASKQAADAAPVCQAYIFFTVRQEAAACQAWPRPCRLTPAAMQDLADALMIVRTPACSSSGPVSACLAMLDSSLACRLCS